MKKSVWLVGGDGWAYDIGFGGLDHVLASRRDVNVLVLDTEVYSNTGGQQSKATPLGAAAKFAAAGKATPKKDLGLIATCYGHVYVARVAFGAKRPQTVQALLEAEAYPGPSLIIAYSHCIAHGYDMAYGVEQQKLAVDSGVWPLYRFDPRRVAAGEPPLHLDSGRRKARVADYMRNEARFRMVERTDPARFKGFLQAGAGSGPAALRGLPAARGHHRAASRGRPTTTSTPATAGERGLSDGSQHDTTSGFELPHPLMPGASPLVDDLDTVSGGSRTPARRPSSCARSSRSRSRASSWPTSARSTRHDESFAEATQLLSRARRLRARARPVPRAAAPHQGGGRAAGRSPR